VLFYLIEHVLKHRVVLFDWTCLKTLCCFIWLCIVKTLCCFITDWACLKKLCCFMVKNNVLFDCPNKTTLLYL